MNNFDAQALDFLSVISGVFLTTFFIIMFRARMARLIKVDDFQKMALPVGGGYILGIISFFAYLIIMGLAYKNAEITRLEFLITATTVFVLTYVPFTLDKAVFVAQKDHSKLYPIKLHDNKKQNFLIITFLSLIMISSCFLLKMKPSIPLLFLLIPACFYLTKHKALLNVSFFIIIFSLSFLQYDIYFKLLAQFVAFATLATAFAEKDYVRSSFASCFTLPFLSILFLNNVAFYDHKYTLLFAPLVLITIGFIFVSVMAKFTKKTNPDSVFWADDLLLSNVKTSKIISLYSFNYAVVIFASFYSILIGLYTPLLIPLATWTLSDIYATYLKKRNKI